MLTALFLGVIVGAILGLTGAGGGILAVPALTLGMGWTMQAAAPVALIAVAGSAALGAADGFARRAVRYRAAMLMAVVAMPMTSLGILLAHHAPQHVLVLLFSAVMLIVAFRTYRSTLQKASSDCEAPETQLARINPNTGRLRWSWLTAAVISGVGACTGLLTGLLGVGGGFVIVPALSKFTNIPAQGVVATSLFVIALVGSAGVISSVAAGTPIPLAETIAFTAATAAGLIAGRLLIHRLSPVTVKRIFSCTLAVVAAYLVQKSLMPL